MRPDSPRDFGAIEIIYLLTYLLTYQRQDETVDAYHYDMLRRANEVNAPEEMTRYAIMKGLRTAYRAYA